MRLFSITGLRYWRNWQIVFFAYPTGWQENAVGIVYLYGGVFPK